MESLSEADFDEALARSEGLVLVDFWADWCGPCQVVGPMLENLAPRYEGQVDFYKVNADHNRRLMSAFGIRSLPTVLILKPNADGAGAEVLGHVVGARGAAAFVAAIDNALNPKPSILSRIGQLFGRS